MSPGSASPTRTWLRSTLSALADLRDGRPAGPPANSLQLGVALGIRPVQLTRQNPLLPLAVAGSFLLALAGVYLPVLQDLLGTAALPPADLALAVGTGVLGWLAARVTRS
jgi:hypothetical protein